METPYVISFEKGFKRQGIKLDELPEWCEYPLAFACQRESYVLPEIELLSQQLQHSPFFIDLIQLKVTKPLYIPFDVKERQLLLYFMLKGKVLYENETHRPIIRSRANNFLMAYYDTGRYFAYAEKGIHSCLAISILPEWIEGMYHDYRYLQNILHHFKHDASPYDAMYQCRMNRKIHRWLVKIYGCPQHNTGALDGHLRKYISYVLEYYDSVLESQNSDLAYAIRSYVQEHYRDHALNVRSLAEYFFVTERTLLNIFKRRYQICVQEYITGSRMILALKMMEQQGMCIREVYAEVGYADERSFRSALERYQKRR